MKILAFITLMCSLLAGCSADPQSGNLVIYDASGNVVARGDLRLPDQLPSSGKTFEGS
jgi:hypothetical protein